MIFKNSRNIIKNNFSFKKLTNPEKFLLSFLIIFGTLAIIWLPFGAGYDEETHIARVWRMSLLEFVPNQTPIKYPKIFYDTSYRRRRIVSPIEEEYWQEYGNLSVEDLGYYHNMRTRSVYSPVLLLPQAIVMRYAYGRFGLSAFTIIYLIRFAGLISYLMLAWMAVRIIPYGRWLLAVLAVSPTAIMQAATISADTISNGLAFLFIGGIIYFSKKVNITWLQWMGILFLGILLFFGKVNLLFLILLPFLFIPLSRYKNKVMFPLLVILFLFFFIIAFIGWNVLAYPSLDNLPVGSDPFSQLNFILTHIPFAISVIFGNLFLYAKNYIINMVAIYGYGYWYVPKLTFIFYMAALFISVFIKNDDEILPTRKERYMFFALFFIGCLETVGLMYLTFTPVGENYVEGVQGRYFIIIIPLLLLAIFSLKKLKRKQTYFATKLMIVMLFISLAAYSIGGWLSYHVICGSNYYKSGLCMLPQYKNWAPEANYSKPISNQFELKQEIIPECNGMSTLSVWLNSEHAANGDTFNFFLSDVDYKYIFNEIVKKEELPESGFYQFTFPTIWDSKSNKYLLYITANESSHGLRISYSIRPDYELVALYENGQESDLDVIFKYGCVAGWQKFFQGRK